MFIFFIDSLLSSEELESVKKALLLSTICALLSVTLSSSDDVLSKLSESFLVTGTVSMLVLPEK